MTIGDIFKEIEMHIEKAFKGKLPTARGFPTNTNIKELPVLFISMPALDPLPQPGTGESDMLSRWELRLLISKKQENASTVVADAAAKIGNLLADKRLSKNSGCAEFRGAVDDNFDQKVSDAESWMIEFSIELRVGEDHWEDFRFYKENLTETPLIEVTG